MNFKSLFILIIVNASLGFGAQSQANNDFKIIAERNIRELHSENEWVSKFSRNGHLEELILHQEWARSSFFFDSLGNLIATSDYRTIDSSLYLSDTVAITYHNNRVSSIEWYEDYNNETGSFKYYVQQRLDENDTSLIRSDTEIWYSLNGSVLKEDTISATDALVKLNSNQYQLTNLEIRNDDTIRVTLYKYNTDSTGRITQIFPLNYYDNYKIEEDCTECRKVNENTYQCICKRSDGEQLSGRILRLNMPEVLGVDGFLPKCKLSKKDIYYHKEPLRVYDLSRKKLGGDLVQIVYYSID